MTLLRDKNVIRSYISIRKPHRKLEFDEADGSLTLRMVELHQYEGMARLMYDGNDKPLRLPGSFYPIPSSPFRMKPFCTYRMTTQLFIRGLPCNLLAIIDPFNLDGMCSFPSIVRLPSSHETLPLVLSFFALRQVEVNLGFPVIKMHLYVNEVGDQGMELDGECSDAAIVDSTSTVLLVGEKSKGKRRQ